MKQKIVDSQSLFSFITKQMEQLSDGKIDVEAAHAQSKLAKNAIHLLVYEVNRAHVLLEIEQASSGVKFRELQDKIEAPIEIPSSTEQPQL